MTWSSICTRVTRTPRSARFSAVSMPMNPPPTTRARAGDAARRKSSRAEGVLHRAQGEDAVPLPDKGRADGRRARRIDELVVTLPIFAAALRLAHAHLLFRARDLDDLAADAHVHVEAAAETFRRLQREFGAVADDPADVVRQPAVRIRKHSRPARTRRSPRSHPGGAAAPPPWRRPRRRRRSQLSWHSPFRRFARVSVTHSTLHLCKIRRFDGGLRTRSAKIRTFRQSEQRNKAPSFFFLVYTRAGDLSRAECERKTAADAMRASGGRPSAPPNVNSEKRRRAPCGRAADKPFAPPKGNKGRSADQFFLLLGRKKSAARKANTTAAVMPALAAESAPVNAPNSPLSAPRMAPRASR